MIYRVNMNRAPLDNCSCSKSSIYRNDSRLVNRVRLIETSLWYMKEEIISALVFCVRNIIDKWGRTRRESREGEGEEVKQWDYLER